MKIGIIGYGHVGKAMLEVFNDAIVYDKYKNLGSIDDVNKCDIAFVCVPTPMANDGTCDTSIVEEVIQQCTCHVIVLRSTVRIGFTKEMSEKYHKNIVFQPEYYGETVAHPFANLRERTWLTFGGDKHSVDHVIRAYQTVMNANVDIYVSSSEEAEMAKYMENSYFANKVIFCNEMYQLCKKMNIDYNVVRELWTADPRIGKYHTFVYEDNPGYGGSCLPKDISSIQQQGKEYGADMTLIDAIIKKNKILRGNGRVNIVVVSGVPGSGKSSLSKAIANAFNYDRVSKDEEQVKLFEEYGFISHDEKLKWVQESEETVLKIIREHIQMGKDLVVDKFYKNHQALEQIKKVFDFNLIYIYVYATAEIINERYNLRGRDERPLCMDCINVYPYQEGITKCWPEMNVDRVNEFLAMCSVPVMANHFLDIDSSNLSKEEVKDKAIEFIKNSLVK